MNHEVGWRLVLWWVLATAGIATVSQIIPDFLIPGWPPYNFVDDNTIFPAGLWACSWFLGVGPLLGFAQGSILTRASAARSRTAWTVVTTVVMLPALWFSVLATQGQGPPSVVILLLAGALIGIAQWTMLPLHVQHARWWIAANALGWVGGGLLAHAVYVGLYPGTAPGLPFYPLESALRFSLAWTAGVLAFAAITGIALLWMLRHSPPTHLPPATT